MTSKKTTLESLWGLFQKPYTNRDSLQKQRKQIMFFSCKISLDLPKSRRQGRFWEPLKKSKMVTPSELYLTMVASKKPAYLRGLRFVVAAKKRIIDGMMDLLCAVQLTKLDKIISIFGPSPGFLGTVFCKILDMLQVHRMKTTITTIKDIPSQ